MLYTVFHACMYVVHNLFHNHAFIVPLRFALNVMEMLCLLIIDSFLYLQLSELTYEKYLQEVMGLLMSDSDFAKRMMATAGNKTAEV